MQRTDQHSETALELFGKVTPETRAKAKEINFLGVYGASDVKLGQRSGSYPSGWTPTLLLPKKG